MQRPSPGMILQYVLLFLCGASLFNCDPVLESSSNGFLKSYDFIIVGAGSAGAVVANRLSEKAVSVLLLEAGKDEDPILNEIPSQMSALEFTEQDWEYKTTRQTAPLFDGFNPFYNWPRAKVLGGCSSMNFMMYLRGNKRDYDGWNSKVGGNLWSYDAVLPYFKKSEDNQAANTSNYYHGRGGYLTVTENKVINPLADLFLEGGREINMPTLDCNAQTQTGLMAIQSTIRDGARCSTNKAFLKSAASRSNLRIVTGARVTKIAFVTNIFGKKQADSVEFTLGGLQYKIRASREIILSAGAINSPQLLMLSGVGPAEQLKALNIPVVADLPGVGENLQDHVSIGSIMYEYETNVPTDGTCQTGVDYQSALVEWSFNRTGVLSSSPVFATGFAKTPLVDQLDDYPDIQFIILPIPPAAIQDQQFANIFNVPIEVWNEFWHPTGSQSAFIVSPLVMRPKSRGTIKLASNDPLAAPIIDPRYFSDPADLQTLIEGCKLVLKFGNTNTFKNAGINVKTQLFPYCAQFPLFSDDYLACLIKTTTVTIFHPVGTCKMSNSSDPLGVVDSRLRVRNVLGLRVVDASIMPTVTTGNTNAPTIMIGERASDLIKEDNFLF